MINLQDQLDNAENVRRMMLGVLLFGEELIKHILSQDDYNQKNYPELPELIDNIDALHERLRGISLTIGKIKDRIETEAEPDDGDQIPVSAAEDFGPDEVNPSTAEAVRLPDEKAKRLLRHIYLHFPEPALTGGQIINRIMDNHATDTGVYISEENDNGDEELTPVTIVDIHDGKIVLA